MRNELAKIYRVFSRYSRPVELEGCPCCTSSIEGRVLCETPLREITAPQLEHFVFKALSTWGTLPDYKYFLPRILELTAKDHLLCDLESTLGKLAYGGFRDWTADEQSAIRDFISALWKKCLQTSNTARADAVLCGAAVVLDDITSLLDYAEASFPEFKATYLANHTNQTKCTLLNSFWVSSSPNYKRVLQWAYPSSA